MDWDSIDNTNTHTEGDFTHSNSLEHSGILVLSPQNINTHTHTGHNRGEGGRGSHTVQYNIKEHRYRTQSCAHRH